VLSCCTLCMCVSQLATNKPAVTAKNMCIVMTPNSEAFSRPQSICNSQYTPAINHCKRTISAQEYFRYRKHEIPRRTRLGLAYCLLCNSREFEMLNNAVLFLVIALIAGLLGFFAIAGVAAMIAKVCFMIFLVLFLISIITGRRSSL